MSTATPIHTPTAPLPTPAAAALARLESAFAPVLTEHHRIERIVSGLRIGESTVINGVPVTAIDLKTADLLDRYRTASGRYRKLAECGDYEGCEYVRDEMAMCRCQLDAAGLLHLVDSGSASDDHDKAREPRLPQRPRGPHPQTAGA